MSNTQFGTVVRYLRDLAGQGPLTDATDGQLLDAFRAHHDEGAFSLLVRRHGPMVLAVARRVLGREADAEDVYQATFLLLARKAGSIRKRDAVASWLHGVAQRLALKARAQAACRQAHEIRAGTMRKSSVTFQAAWDELQGVLDEALAQVPAKYRTPLVMCYLEGKSHEETARELACSVGHRFG